MDNTFLQISVLLAITVLVALVLRILKQPLIVAYIFAGIISGSFMLNILHLNLHMYEAFAEFGMVLLLFIIGINLNFKHLKSIGKISLVTGLGQVLFTAIIGTIILLSLNLTLTSSIYLAIAITFSSTIIIMKLLSDKRHTETTYGKYTIGLMLVQDVIAVLLIIGLGMMRSDGNTTHFDLPILVLKLFLSLVALYAISYYLLPRLLDKIANSSELLFLFTLAWCFSVSSLFFYIGFSLEIGAILAGIALSSSPYQLEIGSRIKPLRDFFLILFFIVLGGEMGLKTGENILIPSIILSLFILIGNPFILYLLYRYYKFTRRNSFLAALTAAQVSEFGFVLLFSGRQLGHISGNETAIFTIVAIATIFASSYLITYSESLYNFILPIFNLFGKDKYQQIEGKHLRFGAWIVGYHRIGRQIAKTFKVSKTKFAVVDNDPDAIKYIPKNIGNFYFGDIGDIEFLQELPMLDTKLIVMTIPSLDDQLNLVKYIKKHNPQVLIIANAYHKSDSEILYANGVNFVMMPHYLGGKWISDLLSQKEWTDDTFEELKEEQNQIIGLK